MTVTEKKVLKKKLKTGLSHVILSSEGIEERFNRKLSDQVSAVSDNCQMILGSDCPMRIHSSSCSPGEQLSLSGEPSHAQFGAKRRAAEMNKRHSSTDNCSDNTKVMVTEKSESASVITRPLRYEMQRKLDDQKGRVQRMDASKMKQCSFILNKLMNHQFGWVFNQPVDPVKLNIPDYFLIISKPMDLGTIKHKLKTRIYLHSHEFAEDVRLTFSNAMSYNPPGNNVHIMAKELHDIFSSMWKTLEAKWKKEGSDFLQQSMARKTENQTPDLRKGIQKIHACSLNSFRRKPLTSVDKKMLREDLSKISKKDMPIELFHFLQRRFCYHGQNEERIKVDIDELDEQTLLDLYQIVKNHVDRKSLKCQGPKSYSRRASMDLCKGVGNVNKLRQQCDDDYCAMGSCINGTCCGTNCDCCNHNVFTQAAACVVESERSSGGGSRAYPVISDISCKDITSDAQGSKTNHDSDGEEHPLSEEKLSPSKALRAALLKSRFADTILRAQQKKLLNNGEKVDPVMMQQEREKLEKQQQQERARIQVQFKAAEVVAQRKAEAELKLQREREREREAARLALQKMEKTVDIDENREILKDLEILGYALGPDEMMTNLTELQSGRGNPLARLGLYMKIDDFDVEAKD